jgi:hypothetical protein
MMNLKIRHFASKVFSFLISIAAQVFVLSIMISLFLGQILRPGAQGGTGGW